MNNIILNILLLFSLYYTESPQQAVQQIINRIAKDKKEHFRIELDDSLGDQFVQIASMEYQDSYKYIIKAGNGVNLAVGFYQTLNHLNSSLSWTGNNIALDFKPLPKKILQRQVKHTYYLNTCTYSYSIFEWDYARWEQEIEWMAMRGINLVLMQLGQEFILHEIFRELNNQSKNIVSYFGGVGFQAWNRMGNIKKFGTPFPLKTFENQLNLANRIVQKMKAFGMKVILPGFSGFVPDEMKDIHPTSKIYKGSAWNDFPERFTNVDYLDPNDPLFIEITQKLLKKQRDFYGIDDHFYSVDQFNENTPFTSDLAFISSMS